MDGDPIITLILMQIPCRPPPAAILCHELLFLIKVFIYFLTVSSSRSLTNRFFFFFFSGLLRRELAFRDRKYTHTHPRRTCRVVSGAGFAPKLERASLVVTVAQQWRGSTVQTWQARSSLGAKPAPLTTLQVLRGCVWVYFLSRNASSRRSNPEKKKKKKRFVRLRDELTVKK
jgi:hypothetical protein